MQRPLIKPKHTFSKNTYLFKKKNIEMINITSDWIQRAGQKSIISFTGGQSITIVLINMKKISLCLLYLLNNSLSNTFKTCRILALWKVRQKVDLSTLWSFYVAVWWFILILVLRLLFPAFTEISGILLFASWSCKLPILNLMRFFQPFHPLSKPASLRHSCFFMSASATTAISLSLGWNRR